MIHARKITSLKANEMDLLIEEALYIICLVRDAILNF